MPSRVYACCQKGHPTRLPPLQYIAPFNRLFPCLANSSPPKQDSRFLQESHIPGIMPSPHFATVNANVPIFSLFNAHVNPLFFCPLLLQLFSGILEILKTFDLFLQPSFLRHICSPPQSDVVLSFSRPRSPVLYTVVTPL